MPVPKEAGSPITMTRVVTDDRWEGRERGTRPTLMDTDLKPPTTEHEIALGMPTAHDMGLSSTLPAPST